jgi:hypothetical protein
LLTVEAKAGATAGVYQLQVRDAGNGAVLVKVTVAGAAGSGTGAATGGGTPATVAATAPAPDPFVKQVQMSLNGLNITVPDATGKEVPLVEDGLSGTNTDKAMTKFLVSQGADPKSKEFPTDRTKLTKTVADLLGIKVPDGWSAK